MEKKIRKILGSPMWLITELFVWSSGANKQILDAVPTEKSKYYGIGGTIVFTALMATFAGGYAFFTAFKDYNLAIIFGLFWGALIFNLDRYIVSSFGVGDGKKTISKQESVEAAPRILMAMVLGFVISTPLELKLFESEINAYINTQINITNKKLVEENSSLNNDDMVVYWQNQLDNIQLKSDKRDTLISHKYNEWQKKIEDQNAEWNEGKFSGKPGQGPMYDTLTNQANALSIQYNKLVDEDQVKDGLDLKQIEDLNLKITKKEDERLAEIENSKTIQAQNDGLLARLSALEVLTSESWTLWTSKWMITFLFVLIEVAPILFKMMTERGPYDDIIDRIKHETKVRQMLLQSNLNEEINTQVKIHSRNNEERLIAEIEANKVLLQSIADAQAEIAQVAIDEWKKEQITKAKNNPGGIVKS